MKSRSEAKRGLLSSALSVRPKRIVISACLLVFGATTFVLLGVRFCLVEGVESC